ncbi:GmrSD restriction endonuclease domain-containing protein [Leptospira dzoumogneensis]|uniref:DUF262 domain-containing protein n=1 Tax=Leptospira dzoumogneensis TaxID=2484904 RepID=A0A4Z1AJY9_9LEPT|nr:DUF262 domain-containing protein [Leptospira dzoumogneensis]TGN00045.1 DUF262 domain-containing protein [Leptospira dzoumogneensis]
MSNYDENEITDFYEEEDSEVFEDFPKNRRIIWQPKDYSIREFFTMKGDSELILQPEYQREYVFDPKRSSRLIESILMDVPIPVIYLAEEENGSYSVIDGQQRLTTFISFLEGKFPDGKEFKLNGLKIFPELNRKSFNELDKKDQHKIRTTTIHSIIIKKESDPDIKFEIFERLNTGSVKLNEDEIRNSVYRGPYIELLAELSENKHFNEIINKPNYKKRMIYRGMILRYFALTERSYLNYRPSMKKFCNSHLNDFKNLSEQKRQEFKDKFSKSVDLCYSVFGKNAFRRFKPGHSDQNPNGNWGASRINMAIFDIVMVCFNNYSKNTIMKYADDIRESLIDLMSNNEEFIDAIETKTSDSESTKKRFVVWSQILENLISEQKEKRTFSYKVKKDLFSVDSTCKLCNQRIMIIDDAEVDHILPFSKGGSTKLENAQITHRFCNRNKYNKINNSL